MKRISRKHVVLLALVVLAVAVGAYAYFTASGSGSGNATVGTADNILLSNTTVGDLYPDGADVPVTVDIENPGQGSQFVDTISGEVTAGPAGCDLAAFEVDSVVYGDTLAAGASDSAVTAVRMNDNGLNQDACQDGTVTITWSSN